MAAGKYNILIQQGSTFALQINYTDSNDNPISLERYGARMQLRPTVESSTIILSLSSSLNADGTGLNMSGSNGNTSPTSGSIGIHISAATSSNFSFDECYYDLEIHSGSFVDRIIEGKVKLSKEVTR